MGSILRMSTSVVTGGAGFLGSHLCEALLARNHRVICVDNLETWSLAFDFKILLQTLLARRNAY